MKNLKKKSLWFISTALLATFFLFQNCSGGFGSLQDVESGDKGDLSVVTDPTPPTKQLEIPLQNIEIMFPQSARLSNDESSAYFLDPVFGELSEVDLVTYTKTIISDQTRGSGPILFDTSSLVLSKLKNLAYVINDDPFKAQYNALIEIDLASGDRQVIANYEVGSGENFQYPQSFALSQDEKTIFMAFNGGFAGQDDLDKLVRIDLESGVRELISGSQKGAGPLFKTGAGVILSEDESVAYLFDGLQNSLFKIDLSSGDRVVISDELKSPRLSSRVHSLSLTDDNKYVLIADTYHQDVIGIDLETGGRASIFDNESPLLGFSFGSFDIFKTKSKFLATLVASPYSVLIYDQPTSKFIAGAETSQVGTGPGFSELLSINLIDENTSVVFNNTDAQLIKIDLASGNREVISSNTKNKSVEIARGILHADLTGNFTYVTDANKDTIYKIDLTSGEKSIVSSEAIGAGPELDGPENISVSNDGSFAIFNNSRSQAIMKLNLQTGERSVISSEEKGTGPVLKDIRKMHLYSNDQKIYLTDSRLYAIISVDIVTGNRSVVSDQKEIGDGDWISEYTFFNVSPDEKSLYLVGWTTDKLFKVDVATGNRTLLSDRDNGKGPLFDYPGSIVINAEQTYAYITDGNNNCVYQVNLVNGDRKIISK